MFTVVLGFDIVFVEDLVDHRQCLAVVQLWVGVYCAMAVRMAVRVLMGMVMRVIVGMVMRVIVTVTVIVSVRMTMLVRMMPAVAPRQ
ncbi:hypothetical protein TUM17384_22230 [Shewanella algae]|nr:hypothetical protein TUM17384_22230 [Shewanella algae]